MPITLPSLNAAAATLDAFATEPVSLARLNASAIPVQWFEGVAIIQELCRNLADASSDSSGKPLNASHVEIDRAGSVLLTAEGHNCSATVRQVGELLRGILSDDIPVPLRLALSQSVSSPPFYPSVTTFSQALAYFERPNRNALIQAVYQRWESRPTEVGAHLDVPVEPSEQHRAEEPKIRRAKSKLPRWFVRASLVFGIISGLTTTAILLLPGRDEAASVQSFANPIVAARSSVTAAASSVVTAIENALTVSPAPPPSVTESMKAPEPVLTSPAPRAAPATSPIPSIPSPRSVPEKNLFPAELSEATSRSENPVPAGQAVSDNIYSDQDADVQPPVAVYPQVPSALFGPPEEDAAIFDLVIDPTGRVESAKLRDRPTSVANAMLVTIGLSAAKAWRFQPAMRQGQPVKYRKTIWMPAR